MANSRTMVVRCSKIRTLNTWIDRIIKEEEEEGLDLTEEQDHLTCNSRWWILALKCPRSRWERRRGICLLLASLDLLWTCTLHKWVWWCNLECNNQEWLILRDLAHPCNSLQWDQCNWRVPWQKQRLKHLTSVKGSKWLEIVFSIAFKTPMANLQLRSLVCFWMRKLLTSRNWFQTVVTSQNVHMKHSISSKATKLQLRWWLRAKHLLSETLHKIFILYELF